MPSSALSEAPRVAGADAPGSGADTPKRLAKLTDDQLLGEVQSWVHEWVATYAVRDGKPVSASILDRKLAGLLPDVRTSLMRHIDMKAGTQCGLVPQETYEVRAITDRVRAAVGRNAAV